jgi:rod shape determining protein RodA
MTLSPIHDPVRERTSVSLRAAWRIDPLLLLASLGLLGCSLAALHGANDSDMKKQALFGLLGLLGMIGLSRFDYSRLREYRIAAYVLLILTNLAVYATTSSLGATRRIPLGPFNFQPSEFGKLLIILVLAAVAVDLGRGIGSRRGVSRIMLLTLIPAMVVEKQPDLGTALVYVVIAVSVLYFSGTPWKHLAGLAALFAVAITLVVAVAPAVGVHVLQKYQSQRLTTFVNGANNCPPKNPTCYQLQQSLIAIGSGQKTGRGVAGASQTRYGYIPEDPTDFIFAVVGETYGFAGAALVLSLYALLIWRTLRILTMAKNLFGTLIAGGILAMLMFQIFLNVGMTIGIMPVTGVPLPLMSYGGSSVIVTLLAIGLLQSIHVQARMASAGKARVLLV